MTIQYPPDNFIIVDLPSRELEIGEELKAANEAAASNPDCDVIIDFSRVEVITSSSLSNLMILHNMLTGRARRLVLCNVSVITKCVFRVAGLDEVFEFAGNKTAAAAAIRTHVSR
ncbi:MAG: STAS domain-containing protein [Sedimentisphaerales bacterium]|nr:STAS domain-containing protein [Sedimentisphaerales bacterium]